LFFEQFEVLINASSAFIHFLTDALDEFFFEPKTQGHTCGMRAFINKEAEKLYQKKI
jgi:hypothetical protein